MFTAAYQPASILRNSEVKARRLADASIAEAAYRKTAALLLPVWGMREALARAAQETKSWEAVVNMLRGIKGFGGTGFLAKECVQDMLHSVVFQRPSGDVGADGRVVWRAACVDENTFCPVGPGARRSACVLAAVAGSVSGGGGVWRRARTRLHTRAPARVWRALAHAWC